MARRTSLRRPFGMPCRLAGAMVPSMAWRCSTSGRGCFLPCTAPIRLAPDLQQGAQLRLSPRRHNRALCRSELMFYPRGASCAVRRVSMHLRHPGDPPQPTSWPAVSVACVWLPQFPLRAEVLRHPAWDGQPLVLGNSPGERKVVQLCSPEAERAGITPGLPLREVLALCREAIILQPDPVRIATALEEIIGRLQRVSPAVETAAEEIFLDLRGLHALYHDDLARLERAIRAAVPPLLRPRLGAADGKFAASVAARLATTSGMHVVPTPDTSTFLAPLPISHLPLPPEVIQRLELLGLHTMGDLAALPFSAVQAQLGSPGARAWQIG